jgi:DNA-binding NarL/FixJ family response regulator
VKKEKRPVYIVTDWPLMRDGLIATIKGQDDLSISAVSKDGKDLWPKLKQKELGLVVICLDSVAALAATKQAKIANPFLRTVVISTDADEQFIDRLFLAGAAGLVTGKESIENLLGAIRQVLSGGTYVHAAAIAAMVQNLSNRRPAFQRHRELVKRLSNREFQVFRLLGKGMTLSEMAKDFGLSNKTVDTFVSRLKRKMGLQTRRQLLRVAFQWDDPPPPHR